MTLFQAGGYLLVLLGVFYYCYHLIQGEEENGSPVTFLTVLPPVIALKVLLMLFLSGYSIFHLVAGRAWELLTPKPEAVTQASVKSGPPQCSDGKAGIPSLTVHDHSGGNTWLPLSNGDVFRLGAASSLWTRSGSSYDIDYQGWNDGMTAVALSDARVLLVGAASDTPSGQELLIFSPCTNRAIKRVAMPVARTHAALVRLNDDQALLIGGMEKLQPDQEFQLSRRVDLINLKTLGFTQLRSMDHARKDFAIVQLVDGRIMLAGGKTGPDEEGSRLVEIFDPVRNVWVSGGELRAARQRVHAHLLADGRVLLMDGGASEDGNRATPPRPASEIWDSSSNSWAWGPEPYGFGLLPVMRTPQGWIVAANNDGDLEVLDPEAKRWYPTSAESIGGEILALPQGDKQWVFFSRNGGVFPAPESALKPALTRLKSWSRPGEVKLSLDSGLELRVGGVKMRHGCEDDDCSDDQPSLEGMPSNAIAVGVTRIVDGKSRQWVQGLPLNHPRVLHVLHALPDGRVLAVGGVSQEAGKALPAEVWSPTTLGWTVLSELTPAQRLIHSSAVLGDGRFLYFEDDGYLVAMKLWNPKTRAISESGQLLKRRIEFRTLPLPDGRVLVFGGTESPTVVEEEASCNGCPVRYVSVGEPEKPAPSLVWNPVTNKFSATSGPQFLPHPAGEYHVKIMNDGRLNFSVEAESVLFDPVALQWTKL